MDMRGIPDLVARAEAVDRPLLRLPRIRAIALLAVLALFLGLLAFTAPASEPEEDPVEAGETSSRDSGDIALYERIAERVASGESYYAAATHEHRSHNYPTVPFVTIRPPTLAWLRAGVGEQGLSWIGIALLLANVLAWLRRLEGRTNLVEQAGACTLLFLAGYAVFDGRNLLLHEMLAGLLLSLSLALYRPQRWWPSLLLAAAALALRELAVHFVLVWLALALVGRRWKEVAGLAVLLLLFAAGLYAHFLAVDAARLPGDPASPGWNGMLGVIFALQGITRFSFLTLLPAPIALVLAVLPLVGWAATGGRTALFALLWAGGLIVGVAVFAREDNFYWMIMLLPAYLAGLAFVPRALWDVVRAAAKAGVGNGSGNGAGNGAGVTPS